jgi:hypothetical protein
MEINVLPGLVTNKYTDRDIKFGPSIIAFIHIKEFPLC